ncbi:MAG: response regulator [Lachnospiraceae bacterium]|nr:response regulator [Lachnospiraceae bacterium]
MMLRVFFILFALIAVTCFVFGVRNKRRNIGYALMSAALAVANVVTFFLLDSHGIAAARRYLTLYYICHIVFYLSAVLMILIMSKSKRLWLFIIPVGLINIYQILILACNYFIVGANLILFEKKIAFGKLWWVADASSKNSEFWGFGAFRGFYSVSTILIIVLCIIGALRTASTFRNRYLAIIIVESLYAILEHIIRVNYWPTWILCLAMTPICIFYLYITTYYPVKRLKDSSLMRFADEMNDAFILYDEYNHLLYMNEVIRKAVNKEMMEIFGKKETLDGWIQNTMNIEGMEVIVLGDEHGETYYRARKMELWDNRHFLGTIYILHDTTDTLMKIGAIKEASEEIERAAKMKSDFLANMSHEIRTPMNAVIGMAELALREELPANVVDYIGQIQTSGKNLLNIINDILDFSKIEAGKMEILPDRYEPLSEINDIANILQNRIGDKKIELFVTSDYDIPYALLGDAMRIRQIIINLANNAIKFTPKGVVHINITCDRIDDKNVMMNYHVRDTGTGIKQEDISKLFRSFEQVDSKRNRLVEGTGLGLAISKKLCEAMGGTIGVTSEYGVGSDFYFSIPQKVLDDRRQLEVSDAENIHAFVLNENPKMIEMFISDSEKLGVKAEEVRNLDEYKPTGKKDFIFFIYEIYGTEMREFLKENPHVTGIILVAFDSDFKSDLPNLSVMRRPETTLNLSMMYNGYKSTRRIGDPSKAYAVDFTAPGAKILIVDDNEINITIAEGLMQPMKVTCLRATSGKEAIEIIRTQHVDVVLMDHMMPEMDGIEATHIIRETIPQSFGLPILALTANVMEGVKDMFIQEGMNDFIPKPIDIRELASKLKFWIPKDLIKEMSEEEEESLLAAEEEKDEELSALSFLDTDKAISGLGSAALFKKIAFEYYKAGEDKLKDLLESFKARDWSSYIIRIHALKSSSRQIGAMELGDISEKLEAAGKDEKFDFILENNEKAVALYRDVLEKLSAVYPKEEVSDENLPEISEEELKKCLESLRDACDNLDMDEMEKSRDYLKGFKLPEALGAKFDELSKAVDNIDSDACMEIISEFL